ncbi:hypothetical protein GQ55_6G062500 [Panicum hallii var. hallii]|uniref:Uncharacterized protein n=1 Tax=Panicum hallii var. hallii TaxID=1504633 RepID=A0A2T7D4L8_9POAL|nr:hypothetical protein GQ55_6G062500 [Panicum hallii var. hallii]
MDEPPSNSRPQQLLRRWRQTAFVVNAGRRFRYPWSGVPNVDHRLVHSDQTGADQERDLEENCPAKPPPKDLALLLSRSILVNQIKPLPQLLRAVVQGTPQDKQQQKRCSKYSQKALLFAISTFVAYLGSSSASSSTGNTAFRIAMAAFFIAVSIDLISATRTPKWGCACLVYLSWFLLVLLSYLLLVSFHRDYCYAIILVPLLVLAAALLQCKLRPSVTQQNTTSDSGDQDLDTDDDADQDLENIFDWSAGIVNCGGLISMILGHYMYMVGPNHLKEASVIGFLFFFTVVLGLYLMMVTTVKNVALTPYVGHLTCLLNVLLVGTLVATLIHGVWLSRNDSHV